VLCKGGDGETLALKEETEQCGERGPGMEAGMTERRIISTRKGTEV
jgi:hypothetical protein